MSDQTALAPLTQTTSDVLDIAKDAIEGVKDWAGDVADQAREKVSPTKKKRSKLPLLLVVLGLGALVFVVLRRRGGDSYDSVAPDTFRCRGGSRRREQRRPRPRIDNQRLIIRGRSTAEPLVAGDVLQLASVGVGEPDRVDHDGQHRSEAEDGRSCREATGHRQERGAEAEAGDLAGHTSDRRPARGLTSSGGEQLRGVAVQDREQAHRTDEHQAHAGQQHQYSAGQPEEAEATDEAGQTRRDTPRAAGPPGRSASRLRPSSGYPAVRRRPT